MKIAYFDCVSGISGDMTLGALVDAGVPLELMSDAIQSLGVPGLRLETEQVKRHAMRALKVHVHCPHEHVHRHLSDILAMINRGVEAKALTRSAAELAGVIFTKLAEAEAKVHGMPIEKVHFHEVGAADSIADIVGAAVGIDYLELDAIYASTVPTGTGTIKIAHGTCSIPAPATAELLRGVPIAASEVPFELTTPTGVAILKTVTKAFVPVPSMAITTIGYGAGGRDLPEQANLLRLLIGEAIDPVEWEKHASDHHSDAHHKDTEHTNAVVSESTHTQHHKKRHHDDHHESQHQCDHKHDHKHDREHVHGHEHEHEHHHDHTHKHADDHTHDHEHQSDHHHEHEGNGHDDNAHHHRHGHSHHHGAETVWVLETNIDDMTGEMIGYCISRLWDADPLDVYTTAIQMKKQRPGVKLTVLCCENDVQKIEALLFRHTTTLGVRRWAAARTVLERNAVTVTTGYGDIEGKTAKLPDGTIRFTPEFESAKKIAKKNDVPLADIYLAAQKSFDQHTQ